MDPFLLSGQGFVLWQHLNATGVWSVFWADGLHKLARKAAYAINMNADAKSTLKKLTKVFRMSRGPFGSGKFGRQLADARGFLLSALQEGNVDKSLIQSWLPGVARDQRANPESFTENDLIALLIKKQGVI